MTVNAELAALVPKLKGARVVCVGDLMLDRFVYGFAERISPEAPIPVVRIEREESMLGGAGNVVRNIVGLGGEVENRQWTASWQGKEILGDGGELVSITVKKGKVDPSKPDEKKHYVDGLAGATITSNGVTNFVQRDLKTFQPYLTSVARRN